MSGRSRGRGKTLYIEDNAAGRVAHVVFVRRCATKAGKKIRNLLFSDLRRGEEGFVLIMQY
ncbi:hypothetical protein DK104_24650 [Salmonella enterica subsp. enterica serovar Lexington]|uniref:Uncharacterized protein n=1 Tax=Salmonella enterica TaxID=28901 RepID=A0A5Y5T9J6_SALER|nr:hypothetical protein [Salmonella enterica subsp. enterica serovar Weltevreden]EAC0965044.1 hypothetical protein [Salmonella enterica subsp. enterica serovar Newport]EAM2795266.1 hypothetical protein [Salmonella enterica]EBR9009503.1 hypothetical protein [Salmonella enterica subsp. enterica serovar Richmond]EBU7427968.1 hypothetical protein [Salmonella enterica subsp. enterica serovar Lexington]EBU7739068.1 hypothetical protein [Salmonella enterica subsp. enterica serovar Bareilly]EBX440265